jgi:hypothetical protein
MLKNFVAYYDCSQRAVESSDMTFAKVSSLSCDGAQGQKLTL